MKKVLTIIIMIFSIFLISGCGETEEDKINSTNPKKYATESFQEEYNIDIEITKSSTEYYKYSESDKGYKYELFKATTKDEPKVEFTIATYWEVSAAVPTKHYHYSTDYENIINKNILENYFQNKSDMILTSTKNDISLYDYTPSYEFKLQIEKSNTLDELPNILYELSRIEGIYPVTININYNNKTAKVSLTSNIELSNIEKRINNLK